MAALLLFACLSPAAPRAERRAAVAGMLAADPVLVVYEAQAAFAVLTPGGALTASGGFAEGEALRGRLGLPPPARGFAEAFVAALREEERLPAAVRLAALPDAREALAARGAAPVLLAHVAEWRLVYDLSLSRHRMVLELWLTISPAAEVAAGRGAMALPGRIWRGACTWRGPDPPVPLAAWTADGGALLHGAVDEAQRRCGRRVAERLIAFLERGEEQSPYDGGAL